MDAQRALSLLRSKAADLGIDTKRIGILGFSAGGHLGAWASTNADRRAYETIDAVDRIDCRPDFAVLIYPGGVVKRDSDVLAPEIRVTSQTPPMFFAHAGDDRVSPENSVQLYLALKRAGVPAELHIYASGGHGFGLRPSDKPCATWPKRCEEWLRSQGSSRRAPVPEESDPTPAGMPHEPPGRRNRSGPYARPTALPGSGDDLADRPAQVDLEALLAGISRRRGSRPSWCSTVAWMSVT